MEIVACVCAALCAVFGALLWRQSSRLALARGALAEAERKAAAPKPPRLVEGRAERHGLLWFPVLTVNDAERVILSAAAGLPYCLRCFKALSLVAGPPEEWVCSVCADRRAGTAADIRVTDSVIAQALREFLARWPGYRCAPGIKPIC